MTALEARVAELDESLKRQNSAASQGYVVGSDTTMVGKWAPEGLVFSTRNGDFKSHIRGVAQLDWINIQNPAPGIGVPGGAGTLDTAEFRRLRLGAEGTMYENIDYIFEFDFAMALQNTSQLAANAAAAGLRSFPTGVGQQAGNTINVIQPTTVFLTFKELPVVSNIRVGNQDDWLSLQHIESSRFQDFMERAPIFDAFNGPNNNGYTPGVSTFRNTENQRAGIQLGAYVNNEYDSGYTYMLGNNDYIYGGRVIWTPYYDELTNGRYMVHTGFGGEFRTFNTELQGYQAGTNVRVRSRGDLRNTASTLDPNYADTGNFYAANQALFNPELAVQWGSWLLQAEYERSYFGGAAVTQGGQSLGNVNFSGGYCELLYFLTGENRIYNRQAGIFNRVVPISNAHIVRGAGCCGWALGKLAAGSITSTSTRASSTAATSAT